MPTRNNHTRAATSKVTFWAVTPEDADDDDDDDNADGSDARV
jgi:hypothetical protein